METSFAICGRHVTLQATEIDRKTEGALHLLHLPFLTDCLCLSSLFLPSLPSALQQ